MADKDDQYPEQEAKERLDGILKGAFKGAPASPKVVPKGNAVQKPLKARIQRHQDR